MKKILISTLPLILSIICTSCEDEARKDKTIETVTLQKNDTASLFSFSDFLQAMKEKRNISFDEFNAVFPYKYQNLEKDSLTFIMGNSTSIIKIEPNFISYYILCKSKTKHYQCLFFTDTMNKILNFEIDDDKGKLFEYYTLNKEIEKKVNSQFESVDTAKFERFKKENPR